LDKKIRYKLEKEKKPQPVELKAIKILSQALEFNKV